MAYICKESKPCKQCKHYRFDEDYGGMACFAQAGEQNKNFTTQKSKVKVTVSCFMPEFEMIISVPNDRDTEEYIDEFLAGILQEDLTYNTEWDFA